MASINSGKLKVLLPKDQIKNFLHQFKIASTFYIHHYDDKEVKELQDFLIHNPCEHNCNLLIYHCAIVEYKTKAILIIEFDCEETIKFSCLDGYIDKRVHVSLQDLIKSFDIQSLYLLCCEEDNPEYGREERVVYERPVDYKKTDYINLVYEHRQSWPSIEDYELDIDPEEYYYSTDDMEVKSKNGKFK